jgi:hypothetical protein
MDLLPAIASGGIWPALPLTGYWLFGRPRRSAERLRLPAVAALALMTVAGIAVWSVGMLGAAMMGVYRPTAFGVAGWVVTLASVAVWLPNAKTVLVQGWPRNGKWPVWDGVLVVGLTLAAGFYFRYPTETIACGADETVYANHGIFLAQHGRLDVPYPWPADLDLTFQEAFKEQLNLPGLHVTEPNLTVQFGHLFPVWLAQAFATFGAGGVFRLNAGFALLSLSVLYGLSRLLLPPLAAVAATLFVAFNPSQLWLARISLSEVLTQLVIWSGLLVLYQALQEADRFLARWAGVLLGMAALVRCDGLLLLPLLFLAHLGMILVRAPSPSRLGALWLAFYQSALPVFILAVSYYRFFSTIYFADLHEQLAAIGLFTGVCLAALFGGSLVAPTLRPWFRSPWLLALFGLGLAALMAYGYWLRPLWYPKPVESWVVGHLATYLSPVVVWSAAGGCWLVLLSLRGAPKNAHLLPVLVVGLGFAGLYLWKPSVDPKHFWAVRRYVPVVVPAFVLFAALGLTWTLRRLPASAALGATTVLLVWLGHFTVLAGQLIWFFPENYGVFESVRSLNDRLPRNALVVAHGSPSRLVPFPFAFGRHVVVLDAEGVEEKAYNYEKGSGLLDRWLAARLGQGEPVYLVCENYRFPGRHNRELHRETCWRDYTEAVWAPLPKRTFRESWTWYLYEINAFPIPADYLDLPLGNEMVWGVEESGFGDPVRAHLQAVRWTNGKGSLVVPLDRHSLPQELRVRLWVGPLGTNLRIRANGRDLFQGTVPSGDWSQTLGLAGVRLDRYLTIELMSDTFIPKTVLEDYEGEKRVGVLVKEIRMLRQEQPRAASAGPNQN